MTTNALPAPRTNLTAAGFADAASDIVAADILVTVGDYTGGATAHMFTLSAHGLVTGDYLYPLYKSAIGSVTGAVGTQFRAKVATSSVFQVTDTAGTVIENTADGTVVFLKGRSNSATLVTTALLPRLIVAAGDFTGGTTEDEFVPSASTGFHGLEETNTLKLLYKAAAGVLTGIAVNTTVFAKSVRSAGGVTDAFETAATSGGADIENTADGLAIFLKTS